MGCNLKTTKSLDCALIGVCVVIRSNMVHPLALVDVGNFKVKNQLNCTEGKDLRETVKMSKIIGLFAFCMFSKTLVHII